MQFKHVTLDFDARWRSVKLDHPEVMNAVSMDMLGGPVRRRRHLTTAATKYAASS